MSELAAVAESKHGRIVQAVVSIDSVVHSLGRLLSDISGEEPMKDAVTGVEGRQSLVDVLENTPGVIESKVEKLHRQIHDLRQLLLG